MFYILLCLLIVQCLCQENICDNHCVCKYVKNTERDFLDVKVDCSYKGDKVVSERYLLPSRIRTLDLSANNLTSVSQNDVFKSDTMQELYLNNNKIRKIDPGALILSKLKILDLSYNEIEILDPDIFRYTRKITFLNLASNKFVSFNLYTFRYLNDLNNLILDNNNIGNSLVSINLFQSEGLRLNKGIKNISLKNISLTKYPDNFLQDAYDLRILELNGNNISTVPELPFTLEQLDLSDNPIEVIDSDDLSQLPALKILKLNNLLIQEIPEFTFDTLKELMELELERNANLTKFSALAFGREVLDDPDDFILHRLSLRGSRLQTLSKQLEVPLGQLTKLDLQGNPWICDCNLLWIKRLQIPSEEIEHLRCASPQSFYNAQIFSLDKKYFQCTTKKSLVGPGMFISAVCLLLACIAMWIYLFIPRNNSNTLLGYGYAYTTLALNSNNIEGRF